MSEVTFETFREAATRVTANLGDPAETPLTKEGVGALVRELISKELAKTSEERTVEAISQKVMERLERMAWPEKGLEVKKRAAELEVDRAARLLEIVREINRALEA